MSELTYQTLELQQQMQENEKYITNLQKTDQQIQNTQFNIKELFNIEFDDTNIINEKQLKATNKMISETLRDNILQSNMLDENLIQNIQNIDYNKYYVEKNVDLQPDIQQIQFCDNIILFYLLPTASLKQQKQDQVLTKQKNQKLREICVKYNIINNQSIEDVKHLRKPQNINTVQSAEKLQVQKILNDNSQILQQYKDTIYNTKFDNYDKDISYYVIKIECQNIGFDELIDNFNKAEEELNINGFYLFQLDITQDFLNNFNKQETIDYLINKHKFSMEMQKVQSKYTILHNEDAVGQNCLSYITNVYGFTTRHKLYNKFVCQLTSTSVQKKYFSNHLIDIFDSQTNNLKQSLQNAKDFGLTRFEITVYNSKLLQAQEYKDLIVEQFNLFTGSKIFYKTPLQKQYKALEEVLQQNLIIVDNLTNQIFSGLWSNYQTQQTIGQKNKFTLINKDQKLKESLQNYSFPKLPCYLLEITKVDRQNISLQLSCYIRTSGKVLIHQNYKKKNDKLIELFNKEEGIAKDIFQNVDNNIQWSINPNENKDVQVFNISQNVQKQILLLSLKQLKLIKKQLKCKSDEILFTHLNKDTKLIEWCRAKRENMQQQKNEEKQKISQLLQQINLIIADVEEYNDTIFRIAKQFKTKHQFISQIKALLKEGQQQIFNIIAFKSIENVFYCLDQSQGVIVFSNTDKYNYMVLESKIKTFKQFTLKQSLRKELTYKDKHDQYFTIYSANYKDLQKNKPCFTLEIIKNTQQEKFPFKNASKQLEFIKQEQIVDIDQYNKKNDQIEKMQKQLNNRDNLIFIDNNTKNAKKFEELKENTSYIIQAIQQFNYCRGKVQNKTRYYLLIDGNVYISNSFFEKQMQAKYNNLISNEDTLQCNDYNVVLQTIISKTTETKNKELNNIIRF